MEHQSHWTHSQIRAIHDRPLLELIHSAAAVHRAYHRVNHVQVCNLISIKTGGCPEDCKYCPQSARYQTDVVATPMMEETAILLQAKQAIAAGATRICLGAAWRAVRNNESFARILRVVRAIADMGAEVCCTLGMLTAPQAAQLKQAGLTAYNHNLDTSAEFYPSIITTRRYQDRLNTLDIVQQAGLQVCCGGIIGMGETIQDRISLLHTLATRNPHPQSVPINCLMPVKGTPLGDSKPVMIWELLRMIATARIVMPRAMVRLSAGRVERSLEEQALCFLAGANSIFSGDKLLTRPNPHSDADAQMFHILGAVHDTCQ